ncbi:MAG: hypothetical protein AAF957_03605 [Planctomycetota bacterium]
MALALAATPSTLGAGEVGGGAQVGGVESVAVERELAVRSIAADLTESAAVALTRSEGGAVSAAVVARQVERVVGDDGTWQSTYVLLDVAARAGLLLAAGDAVTPDPAARPEVHAAQVRVAAPAGLDEVLVVALASPYHAVRDAALDRLARALVEDVPRASDLAGVWAAVGSLERETAGELADLVARSGALGPLADAALDARRRATGATAARAVDGLFDAWIERPIDAAAIVRLRAATAAPSGDPDALVETLALLAAERDGARVEPPPRMDAALRAFTGALAEDASEFDLEERLERVARHAGSAELGRRLLAIAVAGEAGQDAAARCARGAAWSLPLAELLDGAFVLDAALAADVWEVVARRADPLPPAEVARWLQRPDGSLHVDVEREVGRRFSTGGERALAPLVVGLLESAETEVRSLAFSWLCDAPSAVAHGPDLRRAFDREDESGVALTDRQRRWLARLPRDRAMPAFRDVIVRLVEDRATRDPAIVELLGRFEGDDGIEALVARALEEELAALVAAEGYLLRLPPDGRSAALARALHLLLGDAAVPALEDALRRSMEPLHGPEALGDARPQTPKTVAGLLARTAAGRAALPAFLSDEVPRRVRFEAALQLAKTAADDPALAGVVGARLASDLDGVDGTLRMRAIAAFAELAPEGDADEDAVVRARLATLARGDEGDHAERLAAIAALGARGSSAVLRALVARGVGPPPLDLADLEAAGAAARALGAPGFDGDLVAARALLTWLEDLEARLAASAGEAIEREAVVELRGAVLVALIGGIGRRATDAAARTPRLERDERDRVVAALVRRPVGASADDLRARFRGEDLGDVRFRWNAELTALDTHPGAATEFARYGLGPGADRSIDGRLLLVVGDLAARNGVSGGTPVRLLRTGLLATEGEPRSRSGARDVALGRIALARAHLEEAEAVGSGTPLAGRDATAWSAAALEATRLLVDVRRGRVRRQVLESQFGLADPSAPRSGEARLAALARIFRGRAVLAAGGSVERAEAWRRSAEAWARLDAEAGGALDDLQAAIDARPR